MKIILGKYLQADARATTGSRTEWLLLDKAVNTFLDGGPASMLAKLGRTAKFESTQETLCEIARTHKLNGLWMALASNLQRAESTEHSIIRYGTNESQMKLAADPGIRKSTAMRLWSQGRYHVTEELVQNRGVLDSMHEQFEGLLKQAHR